MSVTSQIPRKVSTAAPGATLFPYDFKVLSKFDMEVQIDGVTKTVDVDYTMTGVGLDAGGDITFLTPMAGGETVMRRRAMSYERANDFQQLGDLRSPTLNNDQDAPIMMIQQVADTVSRALTLPPSSTASAQLGNIQPLKPLVGSADGMGMQFGDTELTGDMLLRPNLAAEGGASLVHFKAAGAGAVARSIEDRSRDEPSALDYFTQAQRNDVRAGSLGIDVSAAIQAAVNAAQPRGKVKLPAGDYRVSSAILLAGSGIVLQGEGISATRLVTYSATADVITVVDGSNRIIVSDLTVDSAVTRTAGAGIAQRGVGGNVRFLNVQAVNQYDGFYLSGTDTSVLENGLSSRNYRHGIFMENAINGMGGAIQWTLSHVTCELNDGDGIAIRSRTGPGAAQSTLGNFDDVNLFANTGRGVSVIADPAVPIYGFRTNGIFTGQNGSDSIYLDTYGDQHNISDFYIELDGTSLTGRAYATPPTNFGHGINITANNKSARLRNGLIKGESQNGIVNGCYERCMVDGVTIEDCGGGGVSRLGLYHQTATGRLIITGFSSGNTGAGASQTYGLYADDCSLIAMTGYDLHNNVTDSYGGGNPEQINMVCGFPTSVGNRMMGGIAVGGVAPNGSINVSGDIKKNGTTYTNP